MEVQRYDVRRPASEGGGFVERYWSPMNSPVLDETGKERWIVHRVEDATEIMRANRQLRRAEEEFRAVYDQGLFAARLRLDGTVIDTNRACPEV
jgi:PAS domain-containing protein